MRWGILWAALAVLATSSLLVAVVASLLYGLSLKYDYWSNAVEFLGACAVFSGVSWPVCLALGFVLGFGRETLPFLILTGTPAGIALGSGAAISTLLVRRVACLDPQWAEADRELEYGKLRLGANWDILRGVYPCSLTDLPIYIGIAALAFVQAPIITLAVVGTTVAVARIDEPRVLTMLIPWAAFAVSNWL